MLALKSPEPDAFHFTPTPELKVPKPKHEVAPEALDRYSMGTKKGRFGPNFY